MRLTIELLLTANKKLILVPLCRPFPQRRRKQKKFQKQREERPQRRNIVLGSVLRCHRASSTPDASQIPHCIVLWPCVAQIIMLILIVFMSLLCLFLLVVMRCREIF
ncbi:hypothetical protein GDO78_018613 [Eleutherodactylus coqui]|uniref:Uncharacterized protein n=1 Tax=Eleutherodactylus coqui TaxID=57060 RepID=A0A8J6E6R1_ELECQ|nr:hypothetical protein GDO78_018613 [Eleutherodactylus coqui]